MTDRWAAQSGPVLRHLLESGPATLRTLRRWGRSQGFSRDKLDAIVSWLSVPCGACAACRVLREDRCAQVRLVAERVGAKTFWRIADPAATVGPMGTGLVFNGTLIRVPGIAVSNWLDNPVYRLRMGEDMTARKARWVRLIVNHTTRGIPGGPDMRPQKILAGRGTDATAAQRIAKWWSTNKTAGGAHLIVDNDCQVFCLADLATESAYHAGIVNDVAIGVEYYQGPDAELYEEQIRTGVALSRFLLTLPPPKDGAPGVAIQPHIQWPYHHGPIARLQKGGHDVVGVAGHRDVTASRGEGDPGDAIQQAHVVAGFRPFDYAKGEDLAAVRALQSRLGGDGFYDGEIDGKAGPMTRAALKRAGYADGLWSAR